MPVDLLNLGAQAIGRRVRVTALHPGPQGTDNGRYASLGDVGTILRTATRSSGWIEAPPQVHASACVTLDRGNVWIYDIELSFVDVPEFM